MGVSYVFTRRVSIRRGSRIPRIAEYSCWRRMRLEECDQLTEAL
jgi:hypothetical protein